MYSSLQLALKYLHYSFTASNGKGHGIHSPFVFDFITRVMNDSTSYPAYEKVERLRKQILNDNTVLIVEDFGAGSAVSKTNQRTIASIAKNAAKPAKYGQLLYRMVKYYQPESVIELGSSLGLTSSYLSLANPGSNFFTLEGSAAVAEMAQKNFKLLAIHNATLVKGNFDEMLPVVLAQLPKIDFAFIDGNHRKIPTLNYFHQLRVSVQNSSILIFDDIHWSREMEEAWEEIKNDPAVTGTIDLFFIGLVFFRKEFKEKQHFTIRF